jgi:sugar lactone lactonase YvrE
MIYDDTLCTLGEGPLWHPTRHQLFWCDIMRKRLHTKGQHWDFEHYVSAAGWVDDNTLLIASSCALFTFDLTSGTQIHICDLEANQAATRSNDGRADPKGGFWIGTMGLNAEMGMGSIYRYYKGELRTLYSDMQITNAISFAPDGLTAYFTDTNTQKIMATPLDDNGWPTGTARVHIDLTGTPYRPDGAIVDKDGNLFSAQWGTGRVAVYDRNGTFVTAFALPALHTSCPAFGGPDLTTLFVTTARQGIAAPDDAQGCTYAIPTQYTGQKEHRVIL